MRDQLLKKHPWLNVERRMVDYVTPNYYDELLKKYSFDGREELELFSSFLKTLPVRPLRGIELGPGTGRVTIVATEHADWEELKLATMGNNGVGHH